MSNVHMHIALCILSRSSLVSLGRVSSPVIAAGISQSNAADKT